MGFEAPFALLGLLLAGAPIAIHLIKQRELRTIELPTVALLREAQAKSRKRMQVTELLLLALRVLALALLLACMARPYSMGGVSASAEAAVTLAIVLDDSASMGARHGAGVVFDEARTRARDAIAELPAGSEVIVLLAGAPSALLVPRTTDLDLASARVAGAALSGTRTDLVAALQHARRELARAGAPDQRLLLISDFRAPDVPEGGLPAARGVLTQHARIDPEPLPNAALRDVIVTQAPDDPDLLVVQLTVVRTPSDADASDELPALQLSAGIGERDAPLAEGNLLFDTPSASVRLRVPRSEASPTPVPVWISAPTDALEGDNVRFVHLEGRVRSRVGVVNGAPHRSPHLDELTFLSAALDAVGESAQGLDVRPFDVASIESDALDALDVLVLANVATLSARQGARLEEFVTRGGAMLLTGGDQVQAQSFAAALPRCMPGRLEPASAAPPGSLSGETPFLNVATPGVARRLVLGALEPGASALLRYPDGTPALAGRTLGEGRCAVLTTTIDLAWGDLALASEFVALMEQTLRWLLGARRPTSPPRAGEPVELARPPRGNELSVLTPEGRELPVASSRAFTDTRAAGRYTVRVDEQPSARLSFVIEAEAGESDLRGATVASSDGAASASGDSRAHRRSWVPALLLMAALTLLAEGLLRQRGTSQVRAPA